MSRTRRNGAHRLNGRHDMGGLAFVASGGACHFLILCCVLAISSRRYACFKIAQARVDSHQVAGFYEENQDGIERQLLLSTAGMRCLIGLHAFCCHLLYRVLVGQHMKAVKGSV